MVIPLNKFKFYFTNIIEFFLIYKDVFLYKDYFFKTNKKSPFIIDCGSNIGISVLYFKKLYPKSRIIAFEPNPKTFKLLEKNITHNNIKNVKLINAAVGKKNGKIKFFVSKKEAWSWGDAGVKNIWYDPNKFSTISIFSKKLSLYINSPVDFLKIDIEGMETEVLFEISKKLKYVKNIVMEFHGNPMNKQNSLNKILDLFKKNDFTFSIRYPFSYMNPTRKSISVSDINFDKPFFLIISCSRKSDN